EGVPSPAAAAAASAPPPVEAPPVPAGPVTLERLQQAWPQVLGQLENVSRSSWMLASGARTAALDDDVLTLTFSSQSDVAKFKQLAAGKGPSEDLRQAILAVLGIRVKYIARHDAGGGPGGPAPSGPASPSASGPGREAPQRPVAPETPAAPRTPATAPAAPAAARPSTSSGPRASASGPTQRGPVSAPRASASGAASTASAAAAPVTDWAVAAIPSDDDAPPPDPGPAALPTETPGQFAVDDEPEDAATSMARVATLAPPREGDVLPRTEVVPSIERDDDEPEDEPDAVADVPVPPTVAPPLTPVVTTRNGGVQRYGEAVVRQVLGATFVREEPYEPPTRFS
ncbi:DNA polymerase III subunit gamma and tau, partial [Microbacterium sp. ZW CA_36]